MFPGGGVPRYNYLRCIGPNNTPLDMRSDCTPPTLDLTVQVQTCSTWISLYSNLSPDMFKHVQYEARTVGKRMARILAECFLVKIGFGNTYRHVNNESGTSMVFAMSPYSLPTVWYSGYVACCGGSGTLRASANPCRASSLNFRSSESTSGEDGVISPVSRKVSSFPGEITLIRRGRLPKISAFVSSYNTM